MGDGAIRWKLTSFLPVKIWEGMVRYGERVGKRGIAHIDGDEVDLGVTVLACLGGGHVYDLAGATWR